MTMYDLYGVPATSLIDAQAALERLLLVKFAERSSGYVGDYLVNGSVGEENLMLRVNIDPLDALPAEQDFPDWKILLYVNKTQRSEYFAKIFLAAEHGIELLRRNEA